MARVIALVWAEVQPVVISTGNPSRRVYHVLMERLSIGIAGCGIGGLAVGALLREQGHAVTIFDQFDTPAPVGSGLMIQPVGMDVLDRIGAGEAVRACAAPIARMYGEESGKTVLDVTYGEQHGLAIHRASLFDTLYRAARDTGCQITSAARVTAAPFVDGKRHIELADGQTQPFDLVIDASGARSALSPLKRKPLPFGALWASVNWTETREIPRQLTQRYHRASKMAGIMPIGTLPGDPTPKAAIFWSLPVAGYPSWREAPLEDWKAEVISFWPRMAPFLDQIATHDDMTFASYTHGTLYQPYDRALAYIGDAAHTTSPQLGQGANMALLDAQALAQALVALPVEEALQHYARARHRHLRVYQGMSRYFTPVYQSNSLILPFMRNTLFATVNRLPLTQRIMTRIVSGDLVRPIRTEFREAHWWDILGYFPWP